MWNPKPCSVAEEEADEGEENDILHTNTASYILHTADDILHPAYYILHTAYCILHTT